MRAMTSVQRLVQLEVVRKDDAAHRVYGWASVVEKADGTVLVDKHGDVIEAADLEDAAVDFAKHYRQGGEEHRGSARNIMVASLVTTREIQKAMGLPDGTLPVGWFVGFELTADTYGKVAKGELLMFSIEGEAEPQQIEVNA